MWHVWVPLSQALFIRHYIVQDCHINLSFSLTLSPGLCTVASLNKCSTNIGCDTPRPTIYSIPNQICTFPDWIRCCEIKHQPYIHCDLRSVCLIAFLPAACHCGSRHCVKVPRKKSKHRKSKSEIAWSLQQITRHPLPVAGDGILCFTWAEFYFSFVETFYVWPSVNSLISGSINPFVMPET